MNYDGKIRIRTELDNKSFNNQIKETERKLDAQKATYNAIKNSKLYDGQKESLRKYELEIEKTTNKLAKLREQQLKVSLGKVSNIQYNENSTFAKGVSLNTGSIGSSAKGIQSQDFEFVAQNVKDLKNAFPEVADEAEKAAKRTSNSFGNAGKELKRFGLALFGVRTIFSVVSKASNAYLSQHTETAQKMSAIWTALGNLTGPIIERIADGILKIVGYLNVFVKTLTNGKIDLTKGMNANTKAIKGTSNAIKELNNQMYSFDEMNVEQDTSSSSAGSSGISSGDFKMPELNPAIVKALEDMAHWLQENWDWIWKVGAALGTVFGIAKIGGWLSNIGKFMGGAGTGLTGLLGVLKPLAAIGVVAVGVNLIYNAATGRNLIEDLTTIISGLKELPDINKDVVESTKKVGTQMDQTNQKNAKLNITYEKGSKEINDYIFELNEQVKSSKNVINAKEQEAKSNNILEATVKGLTGQTAKAKAIEEEHIQRIINNVKIMGEYASQNKLTEEQLQDYTETVDYLTEKEDKFKEKIKETYLNMLIPDDIKQQQIDYYEGMLKQIDGIKNVENQTKISIDNQKIDIQSLGDTTKSVIGGLNGLVAKPKVEVQTNTEKLKNLLEIFQQNKSTLTAVGITGGVSGMLSKIKSLGLAHGGILNAPGRGIPVGYNVIAGEAGREAYMPLDDPSAMAQLGFEIGKNVVVDLTNNNYLDNRLLSRETRRVSNQMGYLTNGRVM